MSKVPEKSRVTSARVYDSLSNFEAKKAKKKSGSLGSGADVEQVTQKVEKLLQGANQHRPLPDQKARVEDDDLTASSRTGTSPSDPGEGSHLGVSVDSNKEGENSVNGASFCGSSIEPEGDSEVVKPKNAKDIATELISKDDLMEHFSDILEECAADVIEEKLDEENPDLLTSMELGKAMERNEHRFAYLCDLPLKVILTPLSRGGRMVSRFANLLEMQFGPLHASLQVGSVILEWNDSHLVVPHMCAHEDELLKSDVQGLTRWAEFTSKQHADVKNAVSESDYQKQIELIYHVTAEKHRQIEALVDLIIKYNKKYYYNLFERNCQHFVMDALKVLGVDNPIQFTGGLSDYFKELKKGRSPTLCGRFASHAELDSYVREKVDNGEIDTMRQNDLEFLLAQCFRFHLKQRSELQDKNADLSDWVCSESTCCMQRLEHCIRFESLRIHNFKPISIASIR